MSGGERGRKRKRERGIGSQAIAYSLLLLPRYFISFCPSLLPQAFSFYREKYFECEHTTAGPEVKFTCSVMKYFQIVLGSRTPPVGTVFISGMLQKGRRLESSYCNVGHCTQKS